MSATHTHDSVRLYVGLWAVLLALLGISLGLGALGNAVVATSLIFGIATLKAFLVAFYYMRLRWEPAYITYTLFIAAGFVLILFVALIPDIVHVYGRM